MYLETALEILTVLLSVLGPGAGLQVDLPICRGQVIKKDYQYVVTGY
jgi:hypothetical protein